MKKYQKKCRLCCDLLKKYYNQCALKQERERKQQELSEIGYYLQSLCYEFGSCIPQDKKERHRAVYEIEKTAIKVANLFRWFEANSKENQWKEVEL